MFGLELDHYDVSFTSDTAAMYRRFWVLFPSPWGLIATFSCAYGSDAPRLLDEWFKDDGVFFKGPTEPDHEVVAENMMQVSHINNQEVVVAPRPLDSDEEYEEYGPNPQSQQW